MHVRVRLVGRPEAVVVVESKLTKIEKFRVVLEDKFGIASNLQRLFYGGKLLENGYTFHDYNIKLNDVIQVIEQVQIQEAPKESKKETKVDEDSMKTNNAKIGYKDAESVLYTVGDLIDMRHREIGAWFEGTILGIVHDPNALTNNNELPEKVTSDLKDVKNIDTEITHTVKTEKIFSTDNDLENKPPVQNEESSMPKKGIARYFNSTSQKSKKNQALINNEETEKTDKNLLYKVHLDGEDEDSDNYCKLSEIRPRARTEIDAKDLKEGQKVMVNYNTDDPTEIGYWYDFKISNVTKIGRSYKLIGTVYLGPEAVPQNDTKVTVRDKIFAIEEPVPLKERTPEYMKLMTTPPERRSAPLNCLRCRDDEAAKCKDCGCYLCSGKQFPEKIVLCDECNKGFHMDCLTPPLADLPEDDWYCPTCKRDPNDVIAPGAAKQTKKKSTTKRDWGRGMACIGKTKTCPMPPNHFGPIPGIEVGMCWRFRIQLSESGVHRPPVSGIHGRDVEGAYSIVLSGGYEDDVDYGNEFTYTGSGGRDLSGNKRTAEQSCDQTLTRENKALARNCAVKQISEEGGDAGENWRNGKPVRVVRSYKMIKHFPKYAPKEGIRYDGIYKVVKYYPESGISGYRVWKYLLRRDDPSPAPWEAGAKQFPIVYPDGYLEAEAEKKALKEKKNKGQQNTPKANKKRALRDSNPKTDTESGSETSPPKKKQKASEPAKKKTKQANNRASPKTPKDKNQSSIEQFFKSPSKSPPKLPLNPVECSLNEKELEAVKADALNAKLWDECLKICETEGKKGFVEHVTQAFLCIICQDVVVLPVTTPCLHNFCIGCLKQAFKATHSMACPCCRFDLAKFIPKQNEQLVAVLRTILPGYDAGKR